MSTPYPDMSPLMQALCWMMPGRYAVQAQVYNLLSDGALPHNVADLPVVKGSIHGYFGLKRRRSEEPWHEYFPEITLVLMGVVYRILCFRAIMQLKADVPASPFLNFCRRTASLFIGLMRSFVRDLGPFASAGVGLARSLTSR